MKLHMKQDAKGRFTEASHVERGGNWSRVAMLLIIVLLFFAYIGKPTNTSTLSSTEPEKESLNEIMKSGYMEACVADDSSKILREYCECTYKYIDSRTTNDEFIQLSANYAKTNVSPTIMNNAIDYCLKQI